MGDSALIGGGSGGYLHLDAASTASASSGADVGTTSNPNVSINFGAPSATTSIVQTGVIALAVIFVIEEVFKK